MSMKWSWNGWSMESSSDGKLALRGPTNALIMSGDQVVALADMLVALAEFSDANSSDASAGDRAAPSYSAVAAVSRSRSPSHVVESAFSDVASAGSSGGSGRSRQGTSLRVGGKPVKRGPQLAAARYASEKLDPSSTADQRSTSPAAAVVAAVTAGDVPEAPKRKRGRPPKIRPPSEEGEKILVSTLTEADAELPEVVQQILTGLDRRARLLGPLIRWMAREGRAVTMDEIIKAAIAGSWSNSTDPGPTLGVAIQRQRHLFMKNPDKTYALRVLLPEARVVRRRSRVDG